MGMIRSRSDGACAASRRQDVSTGRPTSSMDPDPEATLSLRAPLLTIPLAALLLPLLISCGGSSAPTPVPAPVDSAKVVLRDGLVAALQVDGKGAVALLRRVRPEDLDSTRAALLGCALARLDAGSLPPIAAADPFVGGTLRAYQEYWLRALRGELPAEQNEAALLASLIVLVSGNGGPSTPSMDSLEVVLRPMIAGRGYHSLLGVTSPLRELMLWKEETEREYVVELPQGRQPVTVLFMSGFASLGWAGFATCDRYHTGGWTKPDRLYAVQSAYDTTSENFRVSYLAHEGQHFWDTRHLPPATPAHRLEYRAKLVELAVGSGSVYDLLLQFAGNSSPDTTIPHSYANGRVVAGMTARLFPGSATPPRWQDARIEQVNAAAVALLRADSAGSAP